MIYLFDSASSTLNDAPPWSFERSPEPVARRRYAIMSCRIFPDPVTCPNPIPFSSWQKLVTAFPTPASISAFRKAVTNPQRLVTAAAVINLFLRTDVFWFGSWCFQINCFSESGPFIESVNEQLKNTSHIEHTRRRSAANFLVNVLSGLVAYCHQPRKPSLVIQNLQDTSTLIHN